MSQLLPLGGVVAIDDEGMPIAGDREQLGRARLRGLWIRLRAPRIVVQVVLTVDGIAAEEDVAGLGQVQQDRLVERRVPGVRISCMPGKSSGSPSSSS